MSRSLFFAVVSCALAAYILGFGIDRVHAQASVTTYHNDNARTGQNLQETILTPSNVNSSSFGKLFTAAVDNWIVTQPLYIPNLTVSGCTGIHNVVFVATLNNSVYAFDADGLNCSGTSTPLIWHWQDPAGGPTLTPCGPGTGFNQVGGAGIVGTPVIDTASNILFVVDKTAGGITLWALSITSGTAQNHVAVNPTSLPPNVTLQPYYQMARPGLLLGKSDVYVALGSTGCKGKGTNNHGFVVGYSTATLSQTGVFVTTPNTNNGGVWQSGAGLAQDATDSVYFETADATFDVNTGGSDYGDSIIKLNPGKGLSVAAGYFTPYNQAALDDMDVEPGGVGPVVIDNNQTSLHPHLLIGSGKTEEIYVMDREHMGGYCNGCTSNTNIAQDVPAASHLTGCVQTTKFTCGYGAPAYWNNSTTNTASGYVYFPENGVNVLAYQLTNGVLSTQPVAEPLTTAANVGSPSISANGTTNGIVWAVNAKNTLAATLFAFSATPKGDTLSLLYDSDQAAGSRDALGAVPHFVTPTIANGKVYVGTGLVSGVSGSANALVVYGLLP